MDWNKLRTGDDRAWTDASKELLPFARRVARGQCPGLSDDEINGVAVEALLEVIEDIENLESEKDLWGRLFDCAWRRAVDKIRETGRKWNVLAQADSLDIEEGAGHDLVDRQTPTPSAALDRAEVRSIVADNLEKLDPPDPDVLRDYYLRGLSQREIGEKYGWETNTVGNRLNQTLKRARKLVTSDKRLKGFFNSDS